MVKVHQRGPYKKKQAQGTKISGETKRKRKRQKVTQTLRERARKTAAMKKLVNQREEGTIGKVLKKRNLIIPKPQNQPNLKDHHSHLHHRLSLHLNQDAHSGREPQG